MSPTTVVPMLLPQSITVPSGLEEGVSLWPADTEGKPKLGSWMGHLCISTSWKYLLWFSPTQGWFWKSGEGKSSQLAELQAVHLVQLCSETEVARVRVNSTVTNVSSAYWSGVGRRKIAEGWRRDRWLDLWEGTGCEDFYSALCPLESVHCRRGTTQPCR